MFLQGDPFGRTPLLRCYLMCVGRHCIVLCFVSLWSVCVWYVCCCYVRKKAFKLLRGVILAYMRFPCQCICPKSRDVRVWSTVTCVPWFLLLLHKHMWCLLCRTSTLCFAASIPCAQTVETSPCGPWVIITFCQLFVKVNDVYVRFIAQSRPPFAASNNFSLEVSRLYT